MCVSHTLKHRTVRGFQRGGKGKKKDLVKKFIKNHEKSFFLHNSTILYNFLRFTLLVYWYTQLFEHKQQNVQHFCFYKDEKYKFLPIGPFF